MAITTIRLRLAAYVPAGGCWHAMRTQYSWRPGRRHRARRHRHDFPEVFWLESGACRHEFGAAHRDLAVGDVVLVRPDDAHGFTPLPPSGFTLCNVACASAAIERLRALHFRTRPWPWDGDEPVVRRFDSEAINRLKAWGDLLVRMDQDALVLDAFLLDLHRMLVDSAGLEAPAQGPTWLSSALAAFAADEHLLAEGLPALRRLAGCSLAHLSRCLRQHHGRSAEATVTALRLEQAARRLRDSDEPVLGIALACGFPSLGHFYRCFAGRFGEAPARWRRRERRLVAG